MVCTAVWSRAAPGWNRMLVGSFQSLQAHVADERALMPLGLWDQAGLLPGTQSKSLLEGPFSGLRDVACPAIFPCRAVAPALPSSSKTEVWVCE